MVLRAADIKLTFVGKECVLMALLDRVRYDLDEDATARRSITMMLIGVIVNLCGVGRLATYASARAFGLSVITHVTDLSISHWDLHPLIDNKN